MIMTATELRLYVNSDETDQALEAKLLGLELLIRAYTNNNFQARNYRSDADLFSSGHTIVIDGDNLYKANDTIQISQSKYMPDSLVTVRTSTGRTVTVKEELADEEDVMVTKVVYPMDIKMGVVNMLKWELANRDKVGVASESISRHSVTYFDMNGDNSSIGFPKALVGFLKPYIKARFGKGLSV